ncbi:MAG: MarR family transcriptional regulator, partial [Alphaproteobacteria bacterium]
MQHYMECVSCIERLHRLFLEVIKAELDAMRVRDINNVQCLILYSIAGDEISVGELTQRSYLLGSNVSYNLKKMA